MHDASGCSPALHRRYLQSDMLWLFKVTNGAGGKPNVQAKVADETKTFAREVSVMVLFQVGAAPQPAPRRLRPSECMQLARLR